MTAAVDALAGRCMLIAEDEWFVADDLVVALEARGAAVVGPASSVEHALALITATPRIDGALFDLNLQGKMCFPVADALLEPGVPFAFVTGYDVTAIPPRYAQVPRCAKAADPARIARALFR